MLSVDGYAEIELGRVIGKRRQSKGVVEVKCAWNSPWGSFQTWEPLWSLPTQARVGSFETNYGSSKRMPMLALYGDSPGKPAELSGADSDMDLSFQGDLPERNCVETIIAYDEIDGLAVVLVKWRHNPITNLAWVELESLFYTTRMIDSLENAKLAWSQQCGKSPCHEPCDLQKVTFVSANDVKEAFAEAPLPNSRVETATAAELPDNAGLDGEKLVPATSSVADDGSSLPRKTKDNQNSRKDQVLVDFKTIRTRALRLTESLNTLVEMPVQVRQTSGRPTISSTPLSLSTERQFRTNPIAERVTMEPIAEFCDAKTSVLSTARVISRADTDPVSRTLDAPTTYYDPCLPWSHEFVPVGHETALSIHPTSPEGATSSQMHVVTAVALLTEGDLKSGGLAPTHPTFFPAPRNASISTEAVSTRPTSPIRERSDETNPPLGVVSAVVNATCGVFHGSPSSKTDAAVDTNTVTTRLKIPKRTQNRTSVENTDVQSENAHHEHEVDTCNAESSVNRPEKSILGLRDVFQAQCMSLRAQLPSRNVKSMSGQLSEQKQKVLCVCSDYASPPLHASLSSTLHELSFASDVDISALTCTICLQEAHMACALKFMDWEYVFETFRARYRKPTEWLTSGVLENFRQSFVCFSCRIAQSVSYPITLPPLISQH